MIDTFSNKHRIMLICLALIIVTLAAYWQVKDHDFVNYDDNEYITENPKVKAGFTFESIKWAFTNYDVGHWHPLTWLSFILDYKLYGLNPSGYHLTNLFLHVINTLLLFLLFSVMTQAIWQSAVVAALFAIHPLHVESVAWVVERKDVLSTLFFILAMISYAGYVKRQKFQLYIVTLLLFILGLMCKPMLVTLPFVLLLLDYWPLRRFKLGSFDEAVQSTELTAGKKAARKKNSKRQTAEVISHHLSLPHLVKEKIPFFILSALSSLITVLAAHGAKAMSGLEAMPLGIRISNAIVSYVIYIWKMMWPQNLAVLYPYAVALTLWEVLCAGLLLICITGAVIRYVKRAPYLIVGWMWYVGTLVPVIGIVQVGLQSMADRYTYMPLIGILIMMAWGVPDLLRKWRYQTIALSVLAVLILSLLTMGSWKQIRYWQNSITLFGHTLEVTSNNYIMHYNIGYTLQAQGKLEEALSHYAEALRINPKCVEAQDSLGTVLHEQGHSKEAISYYLEALRINPNFAKAHYNLGNILQEQGHLKEAISYYLEALRINPNFAEAHNNLGNILLEQGRIQEATGHFSEAVRLKPDYVKPYINLGQTLAAQGKYDEAREVYAQGLRINPDLVEVHYNLGTILFSQGKTDEAITHFRDAVRLKPDYAKAYNNLGNALLVQGKVDEAVINFQQALRFKPDYTLAQENLRVALILQKQSR